MEISLLKQERLKRGWSRAKVEALTERRIIQVSLERWEDNKSWPRSDNIEELCKLYGKNARELGLDRSSAIMGGGNINATISQEENPIMTDIVRRAIFGNLGTQLTGLIDLWPKRDYHYEELQGEINKAIGDYNVIVAHDNSYELTRRQAVKDMALVPVQLVGGLSIIEAGKVQKTDTDILLKHCAAGITACWYLRRGKELLFTSDLTSLYISILRPMISSHSEAHRKAAATLLSQNFMLKSNLARGLQDDVQQAIAYEEQAIQYALMAENVTEQLIANREMAVVYWQRKKYKLALPYAEKAYGLMTKDTPKIIRSLATSGLSLVQATTGHKDDAKISLKEARDLFDPRDSIVSISYSEAILTLGAAQVYRQIGNFEESITLHAKSLTIPDISAMGAIQTRIHYALTEVSRDDKPRDMGLCVKLLTEGITGAKELGSERYESEAHEVFNLLRVAWPRENAVKMLGREHFGLK